MNSGVHCDDDCIVPHSVEQGRQEADPVEARYASIKTVKNYNGENNTMPHAYVPSHVSGTVDVEGADDINEHEGRSLGTNTEGQEKQMGGWIRREKRETMRKKMSKKNSKDKRREEATILHTRLWLQNVS